MSQTYYRCTHCKVMTRSRYLEHFPRILCSHHFTRILAPANVSSVAHTFQNECTKCGLLIISIDGESQYCLNCDTDQHVHYIPLSVL